MRFAWHLSQATKSVASLRRTPRTARRSHRLEIWTHQQQPKQPTPTPHPRRHTKSRARLKAKQPIRGDPSERNNTSPPPFSKRRPRKKNAPHLRKRPPRGASPKHRRRRHRCRHPLRRRGHIGRALALALHRSRRRRRRRLLLLLRLRRVRARVPLQLEHHRRQRGRGCVKESAVEGGWPAVVVPEKTSPPRARPTHTHARAHTHKREKARYDTIGHEKHKEKKNYITGSCLAIFAIGGQCRRASGGT